MTSNLVKFTTIVLAFAMLPTAAFAHPDASGSGFGHGFVHPISGLDHILAMVMVGVLAFQLGGRALWLVPATFILVMAVGAALGMAGMPVPFVELGIALSVIVLGAAVALDVKAPVVVATAMVGLFAIFHGHAHGAEMPANAGGMAYSAGFVIATVLLHAAGIALGFLLGRVSARYGSAVSRAAGGLAAIAGVGLLAGML